MIVVSNATPLIAMVMAGQSVLGAKPKAVARLLIPIRTGVDEWVAVSR